MLPSFASFLILALPAVQVVVGSPAPPTKLALIVPVNGTYSTIPEVSYGLVIPDNLFNGGKYNVSFTLTYPNGTSKPSGSAGSSLQDDTTVISTCSGTDSRDTVGNFYFDKSDALPAGVYQLLANMTTMTPRAFYKNGTCVGPFSYQSYTAMEAWEFVDPPATSTMFQGHLETTITAALSQPTASGTSGVLSEKGRLTFGSSALVAAAMAFMLV
ncbi:hypothetical protein T439DRAFT_376566 [Meredithblackwellia eburnea MCA 4105]